MTEEAPPRADPHVFDAGVPVLGICYGMQTMASQLGGEVEAGRVREFGYAQVRAHGHSRLLDGIQDRVNREGHGLLEVWMSHGDKVAQAFAVFLPLRSVDVMGDGRSYDYVVTLRAVETTDFMTAHWVLLPYELLGGVSNRIINEVGGISRVVYDVSSKPPATIEWE